jgi:putative ATPase
MALVLATSALRAVELVGMPEGRIPLAQAAIYIANAPKSNACYAAIDAALADVEKNPTLEVPNHLKDASYAGAEKLGHGEGYNIRTPMEVMSSRTT